jgi:hypothetical protein
MGVFFHSTLAQMRGDSTRETLYKAWAVLFRELEAQHAVSVTLILINRRPLGGRADEQTTRAPERQFRATVVHRNSSASAPDIIRHVSGSTPQSTLGLRKAERLQAGGRSIELIVVMHKSAMMTGHPD